MSSRFYVPGPDARWPGVAEVLDNGTWYWHEKWPVRSEYPRVGSGILERVDTYLRTQHWAPLIDEDLLMDEGL